MSPSHARESSEAAVEEGREITATRLLDAPREVVWKAWTDRDHVAKWWGPNGFTNTIQEMDVRPGGNWKFIMHGPDGTDYQNHIIYRELVEPERIVYSHVSGPLFDAIVTFTPEGKKTRMTMRMIFASAVVRDKVAKEFGAVEGLTQTLGRLNNYLPQIESKSSDFVISRSFDAPRDLVWKAWTERERMEKWFGPKGAATLKAKNDLRPGGTYHYAIRTPDGNVVWGKWVYREIVRPERLVFVNSFSDENGGTTRHPLMSDWPREMLTTVTFTERNGRTTVTVRWSPIAASEVEQQVFDSNHASMQDGWSGTFEQLENYLGTSR